MRFVGVEFCDIGLLSSIDMAELYLLLLGESKHICWLYCGNDGDDNMPLAFVGLMWMLSLLECIDMHGEEHFGFMELVVNINYNLIFKFYYGIIWLSLICNIHLT